MELLKLRHFFCGSVYNGINLNKQVLALILGLKTRRFFKNFFMSIWYKKPPFTRAMYMDGSKFREHFLKRVTQGTFLRNRFKIGPVVPEEKIFKELLKKFHFVTMANHSFFRREDF